MGAYEVSNMIAPLTDQEYLDLAKPYVDRAEIGMFLNALRYRERDVCLAADHGLKFLRVGAEPGQCEKSFGPIQEIKRRGMKARYSIMKAYLASPQKLAEESKTLQEYGLDEITIMDSAGTMLPDDVAAYTGTLVGALDIPVGFHGHNNLGMSAANAISAYKNGASVLDCGLMGMARSAGNLATESAVVLLKQMDELAEVDMFGLLNFIDRVLAPKMAEHGYYAPVKPVDLILGYAGAHSSFQKSFEKIAGEKGVGLYPLISTVSKLNKRNPSAAQIAAIADYIKGT
jgi:4-hydroxy 2-oxovalerate aldolase